MQFDPIQRLDDPSTPTTRWAADVGTVTIEGGSARYDGKRHLALVNIISVGRVRSRAYAQEVVQVDYTDGQTIATVYFAAFRRGGAQMIDQLFGELEKLRAAAAPVSIAPQAIETHQEKVLADRAAVDRQGGKLMGIGAVVLLAGIVITIGTYSRAASTGGTYVVAYGAIIAGLLMILSGFMRRPK
jgi:hypothetical protein